MVMKVLGGVLLPQLPKKKKEVTMTFIPWAQPVTISTVMKAVDGFFDSFEMKMMKNSLFATLAILLLFTLFLLVKLVACLENPLQGIITVC